jgi:hypothetical protein
VDGGSPIEIDIVERIDTRTVEAQDGEFCYDDDLCPLSGDEIAGGLRMMSYTREDLIVAIDGLADELLDWRPPKSSMAHIDPWQPEPLTIREIVRGIPVRVVLSQLPARRAHPRRAGGHRA